MLPLTRYDTLYVLYISSKWNLGYTDGRCDCAYDVYTGSVNDDNDNKSFGNLQPGL